MCILSSHPLSTTLQLEFTLTPLQKQFCWSHLQQILTKKAKSSKHYSVLNLVDFEIILETLLLGFPFSGQPFSILFTDIAPSHQSWKKLTFPGAFSPFLSSQCILKWSEFYLYLLPPLHRTFLKNLWWRLFLYVKLAPFHFHWMPTE